MTPYKGQSKINRESERLLPEGKISVNLLSRFSGHKLLISFSNAASMKTLALDFLITFMLHGNVLAKIPFIHAQGRASRTMHIRFIKNEWFTGPWNFSIEFIMNVQITRRISLVNSHMKLLFPSVRVSFFIKIVLFFLPELPVRKYWILTGSGIKVRCLTKTIALANRR